MDFELAGDGERYNIYSLTKKLTNTKNKLYVYIYIYISQFTADYSLLALLDIRNHNSAGAL